MKQELQQVCDLPQKSGTANSNMGISPPDSMFRFQSWHSFRAWRRCISVRQSFEILKQLLGGERVTALMDVCLLSDSDLIGFCRVFRVNDFGPYAILRQPSERPDRTWVDRVAKLLIEEFRALGLRPIVSIEVAAPENPQERVAVMAKAVETERPAKKSKRRK